VTDKFRFLPAPVPWPGASENKLAARPDLFRRRGKVSLAGGKKQRELARKNLLTFFLTRAYHFFSMLTIGLTFLTLP
jgi:hypothetical protein